MAFICPECLKPDSLHVRLGIELPPDRWSDEISFRMVECAGCNFRGIAMFEESRRGALDTEAIRHAVYRVPESELASLQAAMESCPDPSNRACPCPGHCAVVQALTWGDSLRGRNWQELRWVEQAANLGDSAPAVLENIGAPEPPNTDATYRVRYFFDTGSGICLWAGNDAAREKYGYPIEPRQLPLPEETIREIDRVASWFDQWMDWKNAPEENPAWDAAENARWSAAARELLDRICRELGPEFQVVDERFTHRK